MVRFGRRAVVSAASAMASAVLVGSSLIGAPGATAVATSRVPTHVYAPYYETWSTAKPTDIAAQTAAANGGSSVRFFTMAFLETTGRSSCTLAWGGSKSATVAGGKYLDEITRLRTTYGGDVIPSFGGWGADQGGTEIGDSCKSVDSIVAAYKALIEKYDVSRLDMDIEGRSITNSAGIDRRNKALKLLQDWGVSTGRLVEVQYTLPTTRTGLSAAGIAVLQNAIANGVRVDLVNPMAFDYYDGATTSMGDSAISALNGLHAQLATLYPAKTSAQLWEMESVTLMIGVDDYKQKTEVTSLADAQKVLDFANRVDATKGAKLGAISIWAIQRDNGGCPNGNVSSSCSGIAQATWAFSKILNAYTGS